MPFVYTVTPGTQLTSSGSTNTEVDSAFIKAGAAGRGCGIQRVDVHGRAPALTAISGLTFRWKKWTTASTAGTGMTGRPADEAGMQAAKFTAAYSPTPGSGGGNYHGSFGCGAAGPGGWAALNPDSMKFLEAGYAGSLDLYNESGTASLKYEFQIEVAE